MSYFLQYTFTSRVYFLLKVDNLSFTEQSEKAFGEQVHRGLKYSWKSKNDLLTFVYYRLHWLSQRWELAFKEKPKSLRTLHFGKEGENQHSLMICFHEMSALALKLQSWFDGKLQEAAHLWLTLPSNKKIDLRHNWVDADLIAHTKKA